MSNIKNEPSFGPVILAENVTKADIAAAGGTWYSPWKDMPTDLVVGATESECTAVLEKRHFPMDGDTASCTVTVAVEGRYGPDGALPAAAASAAIAAMNESNGDLATKQNNFDSQDTVDGVRVYPQMRTKISNFSDTGDADKLAFRASTKHDGTTGTAVNYLPVVNGTQLTQTIAHEYMHVALPASKPIKARNSSKKLYPVLVVIRGNGTPANSYNLQPGYFFSGSATVTDTNLMIYKALSRGWAVISLAIGGVNAGDAGGHFFRRNDTIDYTTKTGMDTRKEIAWAIQWLRAFGESQWNLDPDRIFLWGEDDGGTHAFWHCYGGKDPSNSASSPQLSQRAMPNLVGARNPEVDWSSMDPSLRCALGNSGLTAANGTLDFGTVNLTDALSLSPLLQLSLRNANADWRDAARNTPYYVTVGEGDTLRNTSVESGGTTALSYISPLPALTIAAQRDNIHGYLWAAAVKAFGTTYASWNTPLLRDSKFNTQGTLPTNAFNLSLVNSNLTSDALANDDALAWAERLLGIAAPNLGAQAAFNVALYH